MKRYSIRAIQSRGGHELEVCQVDNNPGTIAKELAARKNRKTHIPDYSFVRIVDTSAPPDGEDWQTLGEAAARVVEKLPKP